MSNWQSIDCAPDGIEVMTKIDDQNGIRNETTLIRDGNLWWYPDRSMYVYYRPTHWRHVSDRFLPDREEITSKSSKTNKTLPIGNTDKAAASKASELKPCPFCGCDRVGLEASAGGPGGRSASYCVRCHKCMSASAGYGSIEIATHHWNARQQQPDMVTADDCPACVHKKLSRLCMGLGIDARKVLHSVRHAQAEELPPGRIADIAKKMHYPECWDTMAYPTIFDAIYEMASCNPADCQHSTENKKTCLLKKHESEEQNQSMEG